VLNLCDDRQILDGARRWGGISAHINACSRDNNIETAAISDKKTTLAMPCAPTTVC
jgi:hypothetical protein